MKAQNSVASAALLVVALSLSPLSALRAQQPPAGGGQPALGGQPPTAAPQQPPGAPGAPGAPGPGRGRGGGFRQPDPIDFQEHDGWTSLFDGQTFKGWSGDQNWKVEEGAITIEQSTGRGIIAWKGQVVRTEEGKNPRLVATLGDAAAIDSYYKPNDWNELHIIAVGNQMTHILNGHVLSILIDEDASKVHTKGIIGLEVEATGKLFARNIQLKKLQ